MNLCTGPCIHLHAFPHSPIHPLLLFGFDPEKAIDESCCASRPGGEKYNYKNNTNTMQLSVKYYCEILIVSMLSVLYSEICNTVEQSAALALFVRIRLRGKDGTASKVLPTHHHCHHSCRHHHFHHQSSLPFS